MIPAALFLPLAVTGQAQQLVADGVSLTASADFPWDGAGDIATPPFSALNGGTITADENVMLINNGSGGTAVSVIGAQVRSAGIIRILEGGNITTTGKGVDASDLSSLVELNAVTIHAGYRGIGLRSSAHANVTNSTVTVSGTSDNGLKVESGASLSFNGSTVTGGVSALHVSGVGSTATANGSGFTGSSRGVYAEAGGSITLTGGSQAQGNFAGLYATGSGSSISSTGSIVTGTNYGVYSNAAATITLNGETVGTTGANSYGLLAFSGGASLSATDVTVNKSGTGGAAAEANQGSTVTLTRGTFTTTSFGALGLSALSSGAFLQAKGSAVQTGGDEATGVNVNGDPGDVTKARMELMDVSVTTTGANAYGARADNLTSLTMTGGSISTTGAGSFGALIISRSTGTFSDVTIQSSGAGASAQFGGNFSLIRGSVTTSGINAHGLFTAGVSAGVGAAIHATDLDVVTSGETAHGIFAYGGTSVDVTDGSVVTHGAGAAAMFGSRLSTGLLTPISTITVQNSQISSDLGQGVVAFGNTMNVNLQAGSSLSSAAGDVVDSRARVISGTTYFGDVNLVADASTLTGGAVMEAGTTSNVTLQNNSSWTGTRAVTVTQLAMDAGTFRFGANGLTVAASGGVRLRAGNGTFNTNGYLGHVTAAIGGTGALTKTGAGILSLTGTNNYAGTTTVSQGTLLINGNSSAVLSNASVLAGTVLGGNGSYGGLVQVTGTLAPGGVPGLGPEMDSLAVGAVNFGDTSSFAFQMDTSTLQADLLVSTLGLNIDNQATLQLSDLMSTAVTLGTKITLINYGGAWNGGVFSGYADDSTFTLGANTWLVDYNDTSGGSNFETDQIYTNYFTLTAVPVPEPSVAGLGLLGICLAWRRRR